MTLRLSCFYLMGRLLMGVTISWGVWGSAPILAQEPPPVLDAPFEIDFLDPAIARQHPEIITRDTISQTNLTVPSLWWAQEQFGSRLMENWIAYPGDEAALRRIDVLVNQQVWSLMNYLERYAFVHHIGNVARGFNYNLRVFNPQQVLIAAYLCESSPVAEDTLEVPEIQRLALPRLPYIPPPPDGDCTVLLDSSGRSGIRGRSNGGFPAINGGTGPL